MLILIAVCIVLVCLYLYYLINKPNVHVVVARYKEDTSWTKRVKYPCLVYDKENPRNPYNVPVNKGHEASVYFKYIIDHYDKLPDYIVFVHGHESAGHHKKSIVGKINSLQFDNRYENINDPDPPHIITTEVTPDNLLAINKLDPNVTTAWWKDVMEEFFGPIESLPKVVNKDICCAQFVVTRDMIRKHPLRFYQKQYDWLLATDTPANYPAVFYEWVWKFVFSTDNKCVS